MRTHKDIPTLIRALRDQGFTVEPKRGSRTRYKVTSPDKQVVIMPAPGVRTNARALLNARAALRRIGAEL